MTTTPIPSPLPWIGGKHYSASRIVGTFPDPRDYDTYVEVFGGAANVLLARPIRKCHTEVFNDGNRDLINFWLQCRDHAETLETRLSSLPYSRDLYYEYHARLYSGEILDPTEHAVLWFYVQRSCFSGRERESSPNGWASSIGKNQNHARTYHAAIALFTRLQQRFKHVQIDCRDFEPILQSYSRPRVLLYCDPPYIGTERYYRHPFSMADHERMAQSLNNSPALVALSYYPHPALDAWYPEPKWRRITWTTVKHAQRTRETREQATEMLLCNYAPPRPSLWDERECAEEELQCQKTES